MALKSVIVPAEAEGMKLGAFLRQLLPDLPESALRRLFDSRDVKLDGIRAGKDVLLRSGQRLMVYLPAGPKSPSSSLRIVYEDEDVLLVSKPAGISVESDSPGALSLTELCRIHVREQNPQAFSPAPCHRLDHRTSGLCLFAKNEQALEILLEAFRSRTMEKYYVCLVRGLPKPPSSVCTAWLLKDASKGKVRILDRQVPGARPIVTGYETLESGPVSRLRVHLITGRTHQIRAHLASLGHPVLGDDLYGDRDFNHRYRARSLKLCAVSLTIRTNYRLPLLEGRTFTIDPPF